MFSEPDYIGSTRLLHDVRRVKKWISTMTNAQQGRDDQVVSWKIKEKTRPLEPDLRWVILLVLIKFHFYPVLYAWRVYIISTNAS